MNVPSIFEINDLYLRRGRWLRPFRLKKCPSHVFFGQMHVTEAVQHMMPQADAKQTKKLLHTTQNGLHSRLASGCPFLFRSRRNSWCQALHALVDAEELVQ